MTVHAASIGAWTKPFIVHPLNVRDKRVTLVDKRVAPSGLGTGWPCAHAADQTGGKRCIRCMHAKPEHYVLRKAAGGSPAAWRWFCEPCLEVYQGLGLVDGQHSAHAEAFDVSTDRWYAAKSPVDVAADRTRFGLFKGTGAA